MLSIFAFLLTIGILVVVHEYGHYLFARLFNVRVITFSIGFGPRIFSIHSKSNEWRLALIPMGGFVKMLDEREGDVRPEERHLAFNNKPAYQKILIALAGPLFNILFAILVYYIIAMIGVTQVKPVVADINADLMKNTINLSVTAPSQIIAIDGYKPKSWEDADTKFNYEVKHKEHVRLQFQGLSQGNIQNISINTLVLKQHFDSGAYLETIGLYPVALLPVVSYIEPHSIAEIAGLKIKDEIIAVNSIAVKNWFQIADLIHNSPGLKLVFTIKRQGHTSSVTLIPQSVTDTDGQLHGRIGVMPDIDQNLLKQTSFTKKYNFVQAFPYALSECYSIVQFNLKTIYQIITGSVSPYNLGGPITIAKVGGTAMHDGLIYFAEFLALISIGLAIMNLLPIPILDGGHIIIYTIELILNRPVSNSIQEFIFKIGFVFVLWLSLFAIYNDMMRL